MGSRGHGGRKSKAERVGSIPAGVSGRWSGASAFKVWAWRRPALEAGGSLLAPLFPLVLLQHPEALLSGGGQCRG